VFVASPLVLCYPWESALWRYPLLLGEPWSASLSAATEGMDVPYADSDGVRIYYQVEGEGSLLVMQHGFTDSLETWYELGYVDALKRITS
jgi:hypothetical protein